MGTSSDVTENICAISSSQLPDNENRNPRYLKAFDARSCSKGVPFMVTVETSGVVFLLKSHAEISDLETLTRIPDHLQNSSTALRSSAMLLFELVTRVISSANARPGVRVPLVLLCPSRFASRTCSK